VHPPEDGANALADLADRARRCRICVETPIGRPLPQEPRPVLVVSARARVLIAGQAPGTRVHASGRPFTDPSGDRLRDWLGVTQDDFYDPARFAILPMGFCFPGLDASGADRPPRRECAPAWRGGLMALMPQIELVLAIGGYAQKWHLGPDHEGSVTETVSRWRNILDRPVHPAVLPLPHPSWRNSGWLNRNPWFEAELVPELRIRVAALTLDDG
jgi:uracil-DNA glycosylase